MQTKPLLNIGEVMPEGILASPNVPDFSGKSVVIGHTESNTIVGPVRVTNAHKVIFVMAKTAKVMHRDDVGNRTELPVATVATTLATLKKVRVVVSPSWGYYALAKDFLRQFQLTYGAAKMETLLSLFEEGGIDMSAFEISLSDNSVSPTLPQNASMLEKVKAYVEDQKRRITVINAELERLTEEKQSIGNELATLTAILKENPSGTL